MTAVGTRVELVATDDKHTMIEPGEGGVVDFVDALGTVHVSWDNGIRLGLIPGVDQWIEEPT